MRIGMIMDTPFPPDTRVENEAGALMANGHEVYLFHIDYKKRPPRETYNGVKITRYKAGFLLYKLSALVYRFPFFHWFVTAPIRKFIRNTKVEILHIHDMVIAEAVFRANKSFSLPVILDLHENRPEIMKLYKHTNRWPGNWLIDLDQWNKKQKDMMDKADHVLLVTEKARQAAVFNENIAVDKITAVPNVVCLNRFDTDVREPIIERSTEDKFTLLYIGDTSIRRGTLKVLEAVELLKKKIPELQLILVGSSSQDNLLYNFVEERKLSNIVRFEGWQKPERLPAYINASDLCLLPLLRNQHHDTTFANKLFQYMACGKPILASDCPAQKEVIEKETCGVVYKADDAENLADAVLELYYDPNKAKKLGLHGAKAVKERWNWDITGKNLLNAYELISNKR